MDTGQAGCKKEEQGRRQKAAGTGRREWCLDLRGSGRRSGERAASYREQWPGVWRAGVTNCFRACSPG
jgi:hypothetical protein